VLTASNGVEALDLARERRPGLVLLDIRMPEMSGIEVCRQLRADPQTRRVRILVVSGVDVREVLEESMAAGADDFIAKPIDKLELMVRVRSLLRVRDIPDNDQRLEAYAGHVQRLRRR